MGSSKRNTKWARRLRYGLVLKGMAVGAAAGVVVSLFRFALQEAEPLRWALFEYAKTSLPHALLGGLLLAAAFLGTCLCLHYAPLAGGSGIPQLKGELIDEIEENWWKTLAAKILGGCLCIGAGLSLGREGPSIQIGAMVGKGMARLAGRGRREEKYLMTCGAGAGLACAFGAPLAGTVFVLEELLSTFSIEILLSTWMASMIADFVAKVIFGLKPVFALRIEEVLPLKYYWMVLLLGVLLGVLGVAYNKVTEWMQDLYAKIPNRYVRLALPFLLVAPFALFYPMALGSGHYLVDQSASDMFTVRALLVLLAVRFFFSIFSFASGAPGGIFLPLLVLGAVASGAYAQVMTDCCGLMPIYIGTFVMMGMTGLFSAIVRSPLTGIILLTEMGGDYANFLALSLVAFTSYVVADLLRGRPIYDQLLDRMLAGSNPEKKKDSAAAKGRTS